MLTIDWDQEDYDVFFRAGLQILCDEHFKGERKVVVVPHDGSVVLKKANAVEVSDEFSIGCVEKAVNQAIREAVALVSSSLPADSRKCQEKASLKAKPKLRNRINRASKKGTK